MGKNDLIKYEGNLIRFVGNAISVTDKLLVGYNKNQIIDFFVKNPEYFFQWVGLRYNLNFDLIEKYQNKWDWKSVSANRNIHWTESCIERFEKYLNWDELSGNKGVPFSESLILEYVDKWDWKKLSMSSNEFVWTKYLVEKFDDKLDFIELSYNENLQFSEALFDKYLDRWSASLNPKHWERIPWREDLIDKYYNTKFFYSLNESSLPRWSEDLINRFSEKWSWQALSGNENFPWEDKVYEKYYQDFLSLSTNPMLPWSEDLIEKYSHKWSWFALCANKGILWTEQMISRFQEFIEKPDRFGGGSPWWGLSKNSNIAWSIQLIEKYKEKLEWNELSFNPSLPWSENFIETYLDKFIPYDLCMNPGINWTESLMEKFKILNSNLADNEFFPWTIKFLKNHIRELESYDFFNNKTCYLYRNESFWKKVFEPYVDDALVQEVLKKISMEKDF